METAVLVEKAIKNNIPMLITGSSGSGKSSIVKDVCNRLGFEVVDLRLAGILPEDIGGLPRPQGDYYEYLMPKWFKEHLGKPFVLFLDEINQASVQVLHALYGVVLDRMVAGVKNPEMRIVAACNDYKENEYVTDLMLPLRKRFPIDIEHEPNYSSVYKMLSSKYEGSDEVLDIIRKSGKKLQPRDIEFGLQMLSADIYDIQVLKKCFDDLAERILQKQYVIRNKLCEDEADKKITSAVNAIQAGSVMFNNIAVPVDKAAILNTLDDESKEVVKLLTNS